MRRTSRLFAAIKTPSKYLTPGAPTGLTGLLTHPAPRSALIYLYTSTLSKLQSFPESSLYRQSTEALTTHRLNIVKSVIPAGYSEWAERTEKVIADHPEVFNTPDGGVDFMGGYYKKEIIGGEGFVGVRAGRDVDEIKDEWDGEKVTEGELEGTRSTEERRSQKVLGAMRPGEDGKVVLLEEEPMLTAEQIGEIENQIGGGLIEEVIQVAEGELKLADVLLTAKVWEDLIEKPAEGQWTYFMRDTGTPITQQPPQK